MTFRLGYITVNDEMTKYCACHATELLRAQSLILDKPDGQTVATVAAVHAHSTGIEVEDPRAVGAFKVFPFCPALQPQVGITRTVFNTRR